MTFESSPSFAVNPPRGCGRKKAGGFYLGAGFSMRGKLLPVAHLFGEAKRGGENPTFLVPPRQVVFGNLAASLVLGEFVSVDTPISAEAFEQDGLPAMGKLYESLAMRADTEVAFDHVGSRHYTAWQFAEELRQYGPSRRVPERLAQLIAPRLPIAIVFTHSQIPVFDSYEDRDILIELLREVRGDIHELEHADAVWLRPHWGLYASNDNGEVHAMRPILWAIDRLKNDPGLPGREPIWADISAELGAVTMIEQAFACSWITKVDYVLKPGESAAEVATPLASKGIGVIDLSLSTEEEE